MLLWLAAVAAFVDLAVAAFAPASPIRMLTKPLPAVVLAIAAWRSGSTTSRRLAAGLATAALGDELLLRDGANWFLAGMLCFAAMHACYIRAFLSIARARLSTLVVIALVVAVAATLATITPHAGTFAIPLGTYSVLLAAMVYFAINTNLRIVAVGALIFMASDTLLAYAKFYPGFALRDHAAELCIIGTYFAAQILIAKGVIEYSSRGRRW